MYTYVKSKRPTDQTVILVCEQMLFYLIRQFDARLQVIFVICSKSLRIWCVSVIIERMGIFGQILLGLLIIVTGVMTLIKNYQVANSLPLRSLEQKLGPGSSYLIWKVLSLIMIFAGFTIMFGFGGTVMEWLLSPLTNLVNPNNNSDY